MILCFILLHHYQILTSTASVVRQVIGHSSRSRVAAAVCLGVVQMRATTLLQWTRFVHSLTLATNLITHIDKP